MKTILEVVNEKGFLWCLMSPDRIDIELNTCEQKLETASHIVDVLSFLRPFVIMSLISPF